MSLTSGTKLGPYEIVAPLGAGGMGEVYRARDTRLGRDVAVKVLPETLLKDADRLRRFEQEARTIAALNHPNILGIHDIGTNNGAPFLVSEFLDGETLREKLEAGPLPLRRAIEFALGIAQGLAAAHEKGVVHRDLKPENVFLTRNGRVKILDFGLAKLVSVEESQKSEVTLTSPATSPGMVMGTVGYMSPEQVRGEATDARTDIFSFGAVLYEMLTGKRAFKRDTSAETMTAILREEPLEPSDSGWQGLAGLQRILARCLEKNVERRFQSASDLAFAIDSLSGTSTTSAARPTPATPDFQKWLFPIGIPLVLLALGIAGGRFLGRSGGGDAPPTFQQLTFKRGILYSARFAPDGKTVIYSAGWDGQVPQLYSTEPDSPESRPLDLKNSNLFAVSSSTEMAISLGCNYLFTTDCEGTLARVPLSGGAPREVAGNVNSADWTADGRELATVRQVSGKFRIEFPQGKVLYESPGGWLTSVRVSTRGDAVAFLEYTLGGEDTGNVVVLDRSGKQIVRSELFWSAEGLAWSPRADEVWFGATRDQQLANEVHALSLSGKDRVILRLPGVLRLHDVSRDGLLLVSKEAWRGSASFRRAGEQKERDLSWLDYSIVTDLSRNGEEIAFSEEGEAAGHEWYSYVRKTDGSPAVKLGISGRPVFSPDGKWVLAGKSPGSADRLVLFPTGVGETKSLPNLIQRYTSPGWMPDGKQIVFAGNDGHGWKIYTQDLDGGRPQAVTPPVLIEPERYESNLSSPDGKLVFARDLEGRAWLYPVAGGQPRALQGISNYDVWTGWSSDGRSAYIFRWGEIPARVFRLDLFNGKKQLLTELAPLDRVGLSAIVTVRATPDGKSYAYTYERVLSELYLVSGVK